MALDERKLKILQAIITDYIATAEPVGSRTIAKKYDLGVSSATIRNEMSDLEEMGFIIQPHASSGRIPSDAGYRLYVDSIMKQKKKLDDYDKKMVSGLIGRNINQIQYLMDETAKLISKMTNYTTIFSEPVVKNTKLNKIKFMSLNESELMVIIAAEGNIIKNKIAKVMYMPDDNRLDELSKVVSDILHGQVIESVSQDKIDDIYRELNGYGEIISLLRESIDEMVKSVSSERFHLSGTNNMLAFPEFSDIEKAKSLFKTLEKEDALRQRNIQGIHDDDPAVRIILHQLLRSHADVVIAAAQGGGESDVQNVGAFLQDVLKTFPDDGRIVGHGGREGAFPHFLVKLRGSHVLFISIHLISEGIILRDDDRLIFGDEIGRQVGIGIGSDLIIFHNSSLFSSEIFFV